MLLLLDKLVPYVLKVYIEGNCLFTFPTSYIRVERKVCANTALHACIGFNLSSALTSGWMPVPLEQWELVWDLPLQLLWWLRREALGSEHRHLVRQETQPEAFADKFLFKKI